MPRVFVVLVAVLLVAIAGFTAPGISTPPRSDAPASGGTPTQEPTSTPSEAGNETSFPPGTSASGIDNATELIQSHRSVLVNRTYAERVGWTDVTGVTDANGTVIGFELTSISKTTVEGSNTTLTTLVTNSTGGADPQTGSNATRTQAPTENISTTYWETDEVIAVSQGDRTGNLSTNLYTYARKGSGSSVYERAFGRSLGESWGYFLIPYLSDIKYEYAGTITRNNRTLYRFSATGPNETAGTDQRSSLSSTTDRFNVTVLVDQRGVVRSFDASVTHVSENDTVTTEQNYSVRTSGDQSPTRPEWVSSALPHLDGSLVENGTVLALEHTGGRPISTGRLQLDTPNGSAAARVTSTFEPGDTLYLALIGNDTDRITVRRNERPVVNESFVPLGGEQLSLTAHRAVYDTDDSPTDQGTMIQLEVGNRTATDPTGR